MNEVISTLFDPIYWATVVSAGLAYLGYYWYKDSKQIKEISERKDEHNV